MQQATDQKESFHPTAHPSQEGQELLAQLEKLATPEEKISRLLEQLRSFLCKESGPQLRLFWELKKVAISFFKEGVHPAIRSQFWLELTDLSKQARSLQELFDANAAFAKEQMELAIEALQLEVERLDEAKKGMAPLTLPLTCKALKRALAQFDALQRELSLLNSWATRLSAFRKELIDIPMKLSEKNRLFRSLAMLGDRIYPRRHELIERISAAFIQEMDGFIKLHFSRLEFSLPHYLLREEIQGFQAFAKVLTLNNFAFAQARERLSECWDRVKHSEREWRKEAGEKKSLARELLAALKELMDRFNKQELKVGDAIRSVDEWGVRCKESKVGAKESQELTKALEEAKRTLVSHLPPPEKKAPKELNTTKRQRERGEKVRHFTARIQMLLKNHSQEPLETLIQEKELLFAQISESNLSEGECEQLEIQMEPLTDFILQVQEQNFLQESSNSEKTREDLLKVIESHMERRSQIKARFDAYRKASHSSGRDLAKAFESQTRLSLEESRLGNINLAIQKLEEKLQQLSI